MVPDRPVVLTAPASGLVRRVEPTPFAADHTQYVELIRFAADTIQGEQTKVTIL